MDGFYGVEVATGGKTKPAIPTDCLLRVTAAALPVGTNGPVTLQVHSEGKSYTIATLDAHKAIYHVLLDLVFHARQDVTFSLTAASAPGGARQAASSVHLTGYIQPADDDEGFFDDDEDDNQESDDEVDEESDA